MELENTKQKIYTRQRILLSVFFGGPLAAGYLIGKNYTAFNEPEIAKRTYLLTVFGTIFFFALIIATPDVTKVSNTIYCALSLLFFYWFVKRYQDEKISAYLQSDGQVGGVVRTIATGVACGLITLAGLGISGLVVDAFSSDSQVVKNEPSWEQKIFFNENEISEDQISHIINKIANKAVFERRDVTKISIGKFEGVMSVSLLCSESSLSDSLLLKQSIELKDNINSIIRPSHVVINLEAGKPGLVVKRIH